MIYTTLNKIREHSPCTEGWQKLLKHLGKTRPDDEPLPLVTILNSNGIDDALWCLRSVPEHAQMWRLYAVWCARRVQHLVTDPRSLAAIDVAERHANGEATDEEMAALDAARAAARAAARDAARAAASAAALDAARAAARAAARDAARDAAWDAARDAARDAAWAAAWDAARDAASAAAWAAARDAAWAAAWDAARDAASAAASAAWAAERAAQAEEFRRIVTRAEEEPRT